MSIYAQDAADALQSIREAGKEYAISRPAPTFDNLTGQATANTPLTGTITAIVLPKYKGTPYDDKMIEAARRGRLKTMIVAAQGATFKPEALDEITIGADEWQVVGSTELAPDGLAILYYVGIILT